MEGEDDRHLSALEKDHLLSVTRSRLILDDKVRPEDRAERDLAIVRYEKKDREVKSLILNALDERSVRIVMNCASAEELWERLNTSIDPRSASNKVFLQREFFELQMEKAAKG